MPATTHHTTTGETEILVQGKYISPCHFATCDYPTYFDSQPIEHARTRTEADATFDRLAYERLYNRIL